MIPGELIRALRRRYAEPQRHYHTWEHVESLLSHFRRWVRHFHRPDPLLWAVYWHDAIYDPHACDNEALSAQLFEREAAGHLPPDDISFAAAAIRATATHTLPDEFSDKDKEDCALFLDLDLSILGAPQQVYDRYETAIRAEYDFVEEGRYRNLRSGVLQGLLGRDRIYLTDLAHAEWEMKARANLARTVRALESADSQASVPPVRRT